MLCGEDASGNEHPVFCGTGLGEKIVKKLGGEPHHNPHRAFHDIPHSELSRRGCRKHSMDAATRS